MRQKNILGMVAAGAGVALLALAAFLLFRGVRDLSKAQKSLKTAENSLNSYYQKNPFPSDENVEAEKENLENLRQWEHDLLEALGADQLASDERSPNKFARLLGERSSALCKMADANGTSLANDFFGFDRYFAEDSELPAPEHVPRLALQLMAIEHLVTILFEERAKSLSLVDRERFEGGASRARRSSGPARPTRGARGSRRGPTASASATPSAVSALKSNPTAGEIPEGELYGVFRFAFEFQAREATVGNVLNRIARCPAFAVVTKLEISKQDAGVQDAPSETAAVEAAAGALDAVVAPDEIPGHDVRRVSGPALEKPMTVRLEVAIYRFKGDDTGGDQG